MLRDLKFALRRLARSAGFSITVIALLGLALGANATLFSVLYGLLYKPLPFPEAAHVVALHAELASRGINVGLSVPYFETVAAGTRTLADVAAYRDRTLNAGGDGEPAASYQGALVQPQALTLLGATAQLGRLIADEDTHEGAARSAVIGWDLWQTRYGGATDAVGRRLHLADGDYRIVGVMARGFGFPRATTQLWLPLQFSAAERAPAMAGSFSDLLAIARLRPGASVTDAAAELAGLARGLDGLKDIVDLVGFNAAVEPLRGLWLGDRAPALRLMLLAVALVLLVAAANICNLYIARLLMQQRDFAILDALGASPWRRARQMLAEVLTLALAGAVLATFVVPLALQLLRHYDVVPGDAPQAIGVDAPTVTFVGALALAVAAAMAASAVWLTSRAGTPAARAGGARHTAGRHAQRARQGLIVAQIALTAALLVGVGLLLRSSQRLLDERVGFERDQLAIAAIADLPRTQPGVDPGADATAAARTATRDFVERVRAQPGVSAVGLGTLAPFGWSMSVSNFALPGQENDDAAARATANRAFINADYFTALGTPLLRGRAFTPDEAQARADVAIVDAKFAQQVFGGADALGRRFMISNGSNEPMRELTIVGVAPTLKMRALDETADRPSVYQPDAAPLNAMLLVRTGADPAALAAPIRSALHDAAPAARMRDVVPMRDRIAETLGDRTRLNPLLELLGAMALTLAAVGLSAVLAYWVRLRTTEFGVRMALGASAADVLRTVLAQGSRLVVAGLLLALPLALVVSRLIGARLYQVGAFDAVTLAGVAALLGGIALAACWLPARRAAQVDPLTALRDE